MSSRDADPPTHQNFDYQAVQNERASVLKGLAFSSKESVYGTSAGSRMTGRPPAPRRSHLSEARPGEGHRPRFRRRRGKTMTIRLTDMQLLTLRAAKQRDGRCIAAPPKLEGDAALEFATRLVAVGVVKKVKAKPGSRVWRRND